MTTEAGRDRDVGWRIGSLPARRRLAQGGAVPGARAVLGLALARTGQVAARIVLAIALYGQGNITRQYHRLDSRGDGDGERSEERMD